MRGLSLCLLQERPSPQPLSRTRERGFDREVREGAGLRWTTARTLAEKDGATPALRNQPNGGMEAVVHWKLP